MPNAELALYGGNKKKLMISKNIVGPDPKLLLRYSELPIGATVTGFDPNLIKTGTWRFIKPVVRTMLPPCNEACPAGVDVRGFIQLIKEGLLDQAVELYVDENPFPAICGRICFHPCEIACNRGSYDEPVSINGLENFIGDRVLSRPLSLKDNRRTIAIIGSGPAGLSCAYFLRRLGYSVKVFEKAPKPGGILRYGIPEYRLPKSILDREIKKLIAIGIDIQTSKNLGQDMSFGELNTFDALFVAVGANLPVRLDIPGIEVDGIYLGLDLLKRVADGDMRDFEKGVAVIGGGNAAIDAARTILRLGGKPAIYYRRTKEEMPAIKSEISDCEEEGVKIHYLTTPVKVLSAQNRVTGVEFVKNELGDLDESNRRRPVPIAGTNFQVDVDAVVLAIGEVTDLPPFLNVLGAEGQLIITNEFGQTTDKRVFAGGDVTHYERTVTDAIKSGKRAAIGIDCYLSGLNERETLDRFNAISIGKQGALSFGKYIQNDFSIVETARQVIHFEDLNTSYFHHEKRHERRKLPMQVRTNSFGEVRKKFTPKEAQKETERCFTCGLCDICGNCFTFCPDSSIYFSEVEVGMEVDYEYCKGCGICANECPRYAIGMVREE